MKDIRRTNGITLIALVITIISVSVSLYTLILRIIKNVTKYNINIIDLIIMDI